MFRFFKRDSMKDCFENSFGLVFITLLTSTVVASIEWKVANFSFFYGIGRVSNSCIMGFALGVGLIFLRQFFVVKLFKAVYTWFFFWLAVMLSVIEVFCLDKFSLKLNPSLIQIVVDTNNMSEITSFFDNYLDFMSLFTAFLLILLGFLVNRYAGKIADFLQKHSKLAVVGLAVLLATSFWGVGKVGGLSGSAPMIRGIYSVSYVYKIQQKLAEMTADKTNRVELLSDEGNLDYLIFIIGESASRHFMGCYGYDVDTTPYSDELVNSKNMYVFTDTISPRSSTALVMPILLSFRDSLGKELDINKYDPLTDVFNKANYQTYWLSNHEKITKDLSYATFVSSRCNEMVFTSKSAGNVEHYTALCTEDGAMLPYFDDFLEQNKGKGQRSLYVFHFMGSHIRYRDRYPKEFARFGADAVKGDWIKPNQRPLVGEYLNTILYTDYVINEIIQRVKDKNAVLVYASDHAEEMWQGGFQGHGPSDVSKYMVEIPMQIWLSDSFKAKNPEIAQQVASATNKSFMTDDLVHVLLDLAKIKTKQYDPTRSVINEAYTPRERYIGGVLYEDLRE